MPYGCMLQARTTNEVTRREDGQIAPCSDSLRSRRSLQWKRDSASSSLDSGESADSLVLLCSSRKEWEDTVAVILLTTFQQEKKTASKYLIMYEYLTDGVSTSAL